MQELIHITVGEQGLPTVSARQLYEFLGFDASQWARWSKKNIINNPYATECEDWQGLDIMSSGNKTTDFVLSLDFAKRLSMLARTDKGEQIRRYFLDCEQQLRHQSEDTVLQRLAKHEFRISKLEQQLFDLLIPKPQLEDELPFPVITTSFSLRTNVSRLINDYATLTQTAHYMIWNGVYNRLQALYGFNVRSHKKHPGESWIDVAERHGQMNRIYAIVHAELNYSEQ